MKTGKNEYVLRSSGDFAAYVRSLRRSRALTQRELGDRIGVSGARISEIERDPSGLGLTQMLKLLHALGARPLLQVRDEIGTRRNRERSTSVGEW